MANNKLVDLLINNEKAIENTSTATDNVFNANDIVSSMEDLSNPSADNVENLIN